MNDDQVYALIGESSINIPNFIKDLSSSNEYSQKLEGKSIILDNPRRSNSKKAKSKIKSKYRKVDLKCLRKMKQEDYLELNSMWTQYISELKGNSSLDNFLPKLVKADFHGAMITVKCSKNESLKGISGLMIFESSNLFVILTNKDEIKRIPKKNSVFEVEIESVKFQLYGTELMGERSAKKFKAK